MHSKTIKTANGVHIDETESIQYASVCEWLAKTFVFGRTLQGIAKYAEYSLSITFSLSLS